MQASHKANGVEMNVEEGDPHQVLWANSLFSSLYLRSLPLKEALDCKLHVSQDFKSRYRYWPVF